MQPRARRSQAYYGVHHLLVRAKSITEANNVQELDSLNNNNNNIIIIVIVIVIAH